MLISVGNIQIRYGKTIALDDFSFVMESGEIAAILGPNGSGKTTFFRALLGLLRPSAGEIDIMGGPPGNRHGLSKIGATIEMPSLYGHLSAMENMRITSHLKGITPTKQLEGLLDEVGLSDVGEKPASKYSLGMKQRLALALALIGQPELLILDEPANGLDPAGIKWFREWAANAPASRGLGILFSSHILNEVAHIAHKVVLLKEGRARFTGTLTELKGDAPHRLRIVAADVHRAKELLTSRGYGAAIEESTLLVDCDAGQRPEVTRLLVESGHDLLECTSVEPTLEDRYLKIMGESA